MSAPLDTKLSALIVNYNTGSYAVNCVESLLREWRRAGRARDLLEIVVVDNGSPVDQGAALAALEARGARVLRHGENAGYAGGMNLAFAASSGKPDDVVAILNPDLWFLPGSVETLLGFVLEHPEVGAVDPHATIDPLGVFHLPRNLLPTPLEHARMTLAQVSPSFCARYARRRLRQAIPWWTEEGPLEADMLSGCCLFLRRAVAEEQGALMDERYPLYYEDTDFFRSLSRRGYKSVHHGGARVLHHWSRSAGVGGAVGDESTRRHRISQRLYFRKFYGALGAGIVDAVNRYCAHRAAGRPLLELHPMQDLGGCSAPVEIPLPRACDYLIEIAIAPSFVIACGVFGSGARWRCPPEAWAWIFQMTLYARAFDRDSGEFLGAWRFEKTVPGISDPLPPDEIETIVARAPARERLSARGLA